MKIIEDNCISVLFVPQTEARREEEIGHCGPPRVRRPVKDGDVQRDLPRARGVGVPDDVTSQKQNRRQGGRHHSGTSAKYAHACMAQLDWT